MSTDNPQKAHVLGKAVAAARALRLPLLPRGQVYMVAALYSPGSDEVTLLPATTISIDALPISTLSSTDQAIAKEIVQREADRHFALGEPVAMVVCGLLEVAQAQAARVLRVLSELARATDTVWGVVVGLPPHDRSDAPDSAAPMPAALCGVVDLLRLARAAETEHAADATARIKALLIESAMISVEASTRPREELVAYLQRHTPEELAAMAVVVYAPMLRLVDLLPAEAHAEASALAAQVEASAVEGRARATAFFAFIRSHLGGGEA